MVGIPDDDGDRFRTFMHEVEPRLHAAFVAVYGHHQGREATAEALAYAWEHWAVVQTMEHPVGYLFRVGQSRTRKKKEPVVYPPPDDSEILVEPRLLPALASLRERQRLSVVLVHAEGWTLAEVADLLGLSVSSVQKHTDRAMASLRRSLRVNLEKEVR